MQFLFVFKDERVIRGSLVEEGRGWAGCLLVMTLLTPWLSLIKHIVNIKYEKTY